MILYSSIYIHYDTATIIEGRGWGHGGDNSLSYNKKG